MPTELQQASSDLLVRLGHTADIEPDDLARARALLALAFDGDFGDEDWQHALGGVHVLVWDGAQLVGHASLVRRQLLYRGRALCTGYVEAVAVHPAWRRRGIGGRMMEVLEGVLRRAFELGALSAADQAAALYRKRGWALWQGPLSALTPKGVERTPDEEGGVFVFPVASELDIHEALIADYRNGDVW